MIYFTLQRLYIYFTATEDNNLKYEENGGIAALKSFIRFINPIISLGKIESIERSRIQIGDKIFNR
jgi:hypothetical protein